MITRDATRLYPAALLLLGAASFSSCGLVKAPFKVAGAVVDGTAYVGKKAYDASAAPFKDTPEEKAAKEKAKKEKEAKDAKEKEKKDAPGTTQPAPPPEPALPQATPSPSSNKNNLPPPPQDGQVPSNDFLPSLPNDPPPGNSVPYQR